MSYIGNEPIVSATRTVTEITATAGQTTFTANGGYTVGYIDVFVNGAQLQSADFTATDGSTVVLTQAAQVGDVVRLVAWGTFSTSNLVSPNYTGTLTGGTGVVNIGSGQIFKDTSGNVGIGTSSPTTKFHLFNSGSTDTRITVGNGTAAIQAGAESSGQCFFGTSQAQPIYLYTNGTERMRITSGGNVGIGTSSPSYRLSVSSSIAEIANFASSTDGYIRITQSGAAETILGGVGTTGFVGTVTGHDFVFRTGNTERMRITSGGQLRTIVTGTTLMDAYTCRAWVNFNGSGGIRASANVSSVSRNGTGNYTINFSTAMPDTNYTFCWGMWRNQDTGASRVGVMQGYTNTAYGTGSLQVLTRWADGGGESYEDPLYASIHIFR